MSSLTTSDTLLNSRHRMGNKLITICKHKRHKRESNKLVTLKVTCSEVNEEIDDDEFFTPISHLSELKDEEIVDTDDYDVVDHMIKVSEKGQSSPPSFVCKICVELRPLYDSFNIKSCCHFYCNSCVISYISSKLDDNLINFSCLESNCEAKLEFHDCRLILPDDLFEKWGFALCESAVVGNKKFYCPYNDCSAMLIKEGRKVIKKSECPFCGRLFCVQCKVPWHPEFNCSKFRKMEKHGGDAMVVDLAKKKKWKKCPNCNYFVEKSSGCLHMKCRCGCAFCYGCGARSSVGYHKCPALKWM